MNQVDSYQGCAPPLYFENAVDAELAAEIKATRLSDVIERNTGLDVQDEVFWTRDTLVFRNGLDNEWLFRDFGDNGGAEVVFFGEPGIRDPDNREETAPVQRDEPINAEIDGGPGRDRVRVNTGRGVGGGYHQGHNPYAGHVQSPVERPIRDAMPWQFAMQSHDRAIREMFGL